MPQIDLRDEQAGARECEGVDIVFHEDALPSVALSVKDPAPAAQRKSMGTFNLLQSTRHAKAKWVVYAASSSAYGNQNPLPQKESMLPAPLMRTR